MHHSFSRFRRGSPLLGRLAFFLLLIALGACETSKRGFPEVGAPTKDADAGIGTLDSPSKLVAEITEGKVQYTIPKEQLAQNFIRQFNDGTVIDKAMIRKVQSTPKDKPAYFLVGLGLRNGQFRAMALPLQQSTDNSLYLSSAAERYIIESSGCQFCFFNFENNQIMGTSCEENGGGASCDLTVERKNTFFAATAARR
ncbi:hypothetical protein F0P96_16550 [Hymenobacter busanensis]|uniref:Uncharacterized protein n=1 Tax=Hymenobacter busanensis TaxID=2607656 RepID=A0A7L4ZV44_9BACT|nr:hypothetical protein [Hymenobacter busanensis]KAA9327589.1 hypothetical protein F0P96_16550 [Hymenobacter busanensis]QHJ06072.1 hypothetical protein GUY19_01685 [Hymenobacter busanensis]